MDSARKILQFIRPGTIIEFPQDNEKEIQQPKLINRLNYLNFQDGSLLVNFKHTKFARTMSLEARPLPCQDDLLECIWVDPSDVAQKIKSSTFENIFVIDGYKLVVVAPALLELTERGISFRLPETAREVCYRKVRRHLCDGVNSQLMQNSALFDGVLLDFNAVSFRVEVAAKPPQTFQWLDADLPVNVAGLLLVSFGVILLALETQIPSHGVLTVIAGACVAIGAGTLYGNPGAPTIPGVEVAWPVIVVAVGLTVLFGVVIAVTAFLVRRMRNSPVLVGSLRVAGEAAIVSTDINPLGTVHAVGEEWTARSLDGRPLARGAAVRVVRQDGLVLYVSPVEPRPAT